MLYCSPLMNAQKIHLTGSNMNSMQQHQPHGHGMLPPPMSPCSMNRQSPMYRQQTSSYHAPSPHQQMYQHQYQPQLMQPPSCHQQPHQLPSSPHHQNQPSQHVNPYQNQQSHQVNTYHQQSQPQQQQSYNHISNTMSYRDSRVSSPHRQRSQRQVPPPLPGLDDDDIPSPHGQYSNDRVQNGIQHEIRSDMSLQDSDYFDLDDVFPDFDHQTYSQVILDETIPFGSIIDEPTEKSKREEIASVASPTISSTCNSNQATAANSRPNSANSPAESNVDSTTNLRGEVDERSTSDDQKVLETPGILSRFNSQSSLGSPDPPAESAPSKQKQPSTYFSLGSPSRVPNMQYTNPKDTKEKIVHYLESNATSAATSKSNSPTQQHAAKRPRIISNGTELYEEVKETYSFVIGADMYAPPSCPPSQPQSPVQRPRMAAQPYNFNEQTSQPSQSFNFAQESTRFNANNQQQQQQPQQQYQQCSMQRYPQNYQQPYQQCSMPRYPQNYQQQSQPVPNVNMYGSCPDLSPTRTQNQNQKSDYNYNNSNSYNQCDYGTGQAHAAQPQGPRHHIPLSQDNFMQSLINNRSNAFRSNPHFPLLRDLIIADMNFHSPNFPFPLIANLPADFDRLLQNYQSRQPANLAYDLPEALRGVMMDALKYAHSRLIEKIRLRKIKEGYEEPNKTMNSNSLEDFCERFDQAVKNSGMSQAETVQTSLSMTPAQLPPCPGTPKSHGGQQQPQPQSPMLPPQHNQSRIPMTPSQQHMPMTPSLQNQTSMPMTPSQHNQSGMHMTPSQHNQSGMPMTPSLESQPSISMTPSPHGQQNMPMTPPLHNQANMAMTPSQRYQPSMPMTPPQNPMQPHMFFPPHFQESRRSQSLPPSPRKMMPHPMNMMMRPMMHDSVSDFNIHVAGKRPHETTQTTTGKNKVLPKEAVQLMTDWLRKHQDNPYPNDDEKEILITKTKLTMNQINYWFTNARRRILPKWALQRYMDQQQKSKDEDKQKLKTVDDDSGSVVGSSVS